MGTVEKAVILAAGLGTRLLPATKAIPKEMVTVFGKPLIQYVIEEVIEAGITDILVIIGTQHQAIVEHFQGEGRAREHALKTNDHATLAALENNIFPANIKFTTQQEPLGTAHAVLQAKSFIGKDSFALLFPDDIIINPGGPNCISQLKQAYTDHEANIVAVEQVPSELIPFYGIVALQENIDQSKQSSLVPIKDLIEKPSIELAPSNLGIVGRYILRSEIFKEIESLESSEIGELHITQALSHLVISNREVYAYIYEGSRYDTGRPIGHVLANLAIAWEDPVAKQELLNYLKHLNKETD